jgi:para-aminobenzoate synthetase component II
VRVLLVDHEDSFVYNIAQSLAAAGARVTCLRATEPTAAAVGSDPDAIVLSPGPGHPRDRRVSRLAHELLRRWDRERPFLGVCLGHQIVGEHYGARVVLAPEPVHGESRPVSHDGRGVFEGLPSPFLGARYHSLVVDGESVPADLEVTATDPGGLVMAVRHRTRPVESVQFHPESYLTSQGSRLLRNFLKSARR